MEKSETIGELAKALVKVQAELQPAVKGQVNPFFKSSYANLLEIWEVCRKPLTDNGLSVTQIAESEEGKAILETVLMHESGEWIKGRLPLMPIKQDPQGQGSAITYARRYSLAAIVGVSTEDDDAEAATSHKQEATVKVVGAAPGDATEKQKEDLKKFDAKRIAEIMKERGFPKKLTKLNADILIDQLVVEQETKGLPEVVDD